MILEVGGNVVSKQADDAAITAAIHSLAQQSEDEAFAILSRNDDSYIQTVRGTDGLFGLEYQEGSTEAHYGCYEDLDEATIIREFILYLQGDEHWRMARVWEKMEI
jgi:hypothetical protein